MRVGILVASVSRAAGGVHTSIQELTGALAGLGASVTVFSIEDEHTADDLGGWNVDMRVFRGLGTLGYSIGLHRDLIRTPIDVLHSHGVWKFTDVIALDWRRRTSRPLVVSTHGMLDPWALRHATVKKRCASLLYTRRLLRRASCLHALCPEEALALRGFGSRSPIALIPNGVTLPLAEDEPTRPAMWCGDWSAKRVLLYLGRLHAKKGLQQLIEAWHQALRSSPEAMKPWALAIHGWGDEHYVQRLRRMVESHGTGASVRVLGPAYGEDKRALFRSAEGFVLPSLSEGLPMAILEAWSFGLPVIMTEQCNLPLGFAAGAALRTAAGPDELERAILTLLAMTDEERRAMGGRGHELVSNRYEWSAIGHDVLRTYEWLARGGERPLFVQSGPASER